MDGLINLGRELWDHPEGGFFEFDTHRILKERFLSLGFEVVDHKGMPGFYAVADGARNTGRFALIADMDALPLPGSGGYIHSCGHHIQGTVLFGAARFLTERNPAVLDDIVFISVPAEEYIELDRRAAVAAEHGLSALSGKQELLRRGFFDAFEAVIATHACGGSGRFINSVLLMNGFLVQSFEFHGLAAHAGAQPHRGRNAQNAASLFLQTCAFLRETFDEKQHIRIHPVLRLAEGQSVNLIPDYASVETFVRAADAGAVDDVAGKLDAAAAGCARALGMRAETRRTIGYAPFEVNPRLHEILRQTAGKWGVPFIEENFSAASSDMGDLSQEKPSIIVGLPGTNGRFHNPEFAVIDEEEAYVFSSEFLADYLSDLNLVPPV